MSRKEALQAFMKKYNNISFMGENVAPILRNLERADKDGCLREFLLNEKPYQSAFTFLCLMTIIGRLGERIRWQLFLL